MTDTKLPFLVYSNVTNIPTGKWVKNDKDNRIKAWFLMRSCESHCFDHHAYLSPIVT